MYKKYFAIAAFFLVCGLYLSDVIARWDERRWEEQFPEEGFLGIAE